MAAISAAVLAASSTAYVGKKIAKVEKNKVLTNNGDDWEWVDLEPSSASPCKCPGCGSFEYEMLGSRNVCSYCRTPKIG